MVTKETEKTTTKKTTTTTNIATKSNNQSYYRPIVSYSSHDSFISAW